MKAIDDNQRVLINTLLYVIKKLGSTGEFHEVFKILYFAEQEHIKRFGKLLLDDTYIAMKYGPVPSKSYRILKDVMQGGYKEYFTSVTDRMVRAIAEPDMDYLSESEIDCIDNSLKQFGGLSFIAKTEKSHDKAYDATPLNQAMDIINIGRAGGANDDTLRYLHENLETKRELFK